MIKNITFSFFAIYLLNGCTADLVEPEIDFKPPVYVEEMPSKEEQQDFVSTGSIFGQGDSPLFSDHKAMHINDIVKVLISETAQSSSSGAKQLSESNTLGLTGLTFSGGANNTAMQANINSLNGITDAGVSSRSNSSFKGQGSATKDAKFSTTITARIVKVLSNDNYFIMGKREILIDNQKQIIQISGVIRPYDINQNNEILSSQMSEAKILYKTEGDVDGATKQGWATKIVQAVWPF